MKILIISAADPYKVSGTVAHDIYSGLSKIEGNEVKLLVKYCDSKDKNIISFESATQLFLQRLFNKIKKIFIKIGLLPQTKTNPDYHVQNVDQTLTFYNTNKLLQKVNMKPDAIIFLFMQGFISYKNIYELNKTTGAPVYLYPMDMAPFTGGCHYAWDCTGYQKQCGNCPAIYSSNPTDQTNINHSYKMEYMQKTNVHLFAANSQISNQIKNSSIFKNKKITEGVYPVPNKNIFKILPKKEVRDFFNINPDAIVLFFGAVSLNEKRKGMQILIQSLNMVYEKLIECGYDTNKITLLVAGTNLSNQLNEIGFKTKCLGFITDYNLLAKAYNVADYFICPSIEEAGPTMILQSILCNTPTISFDIGFAIDFIKKNINGFKAIEKNQFALSEVIVKSIYLRPDKYHEMKANLKETAKSINYNDVIKKIANGLSDD